MRIAMALVALFMVAATGSLATMVHANERIISDPNHQIALFGYDPVAYLADGEPRLGISEFEVIYDRLVWRFANEGNMLAFADDPQRFVPAYGGHDALMVSRGAAAVGQPNVWWALGGRVFLFRNAASRYAFLLEAAAQIRLADTAWPQVRETLSP
ncbi:MAG: YHS domain-containing (seleno)protein [Pseudomonadota bacterium]